MSATIPTRRDFVAAWLGAPAAPLLFGPSGGAAAQADTLALTPRCGPRDAATPAQTEGPFFTPSTPQKRSFRGDGRPGEPITLIGFVLGADCRPVARALVELWHADSAGQYDNRGYDLRGHQTSDGMGRYLFETIVPGAYDRRTRHFHVKVAPPGGAVLTTQLYFPDEPANRRDAIFDRRLVMQVGDASDGKLARFDFVVAG